MVTTADVPGRLPVAINGHPYLADANGFVRETVQVIRQQADTSFEPGESSLNPQGLWRRSQESWVHGAGQTFLDGRKGLSAYTQVSQDPERYRSSKGIDTWTQGQMSLLNKTLQIWRSTNTNLALLPVAHPINGGTILFIADGTEVYFSNAPANFLSYNTSSIEVDTSGWQTGVWSAGTWSAGGNTTLSRSTAAFSWGAASLQLTPIAAGTITAGTATGTAGIPVDPGRTYYGGYDMMVAPVAGRVNTIFFDWYNAAGAYLSTSTGSALGDSTSLQLSQTMNAGSGAVAPTNAAYMALRTQFAATSGATDVHRIDGVYVTTGNGPYPAATPYTATVIQAGQAAQTVQQIATDGFNVWAALGTSGLHRTAPTILGVADVPAAPAGGNISRVGYANGFLLAAGSSSSSTARNVLWQVNDPLGTPSLSVIKTHPSIQFSWEGVASGRNVVYAWGNNGTNGEVYKISFDPNTGALSTAASFATYLPNGEKIQTLQFYAGGIIMGTSLGLRLGTAGGDGSIDYGPLISTPYPVRCLEPQDRYCWFGWSNYDSSSTGLGRVDLGFMVDNLTPAYASDLMAVPGAPGGAVQGEVTSAITFVPYFMGTANLGQRRIFAVSGVGVFMEDTGNLESSRVVSGQLQTGTVRFSTSEPKTTRSMDLRHHALPAGASVKVEMQRDSSGVWETLGSSSTAGSYGPAASFDALSEMAEGLEFRFTLSRATIMSQSPELTRWTAKVLPVPSTIDETFTIPIEMRSEVLTNTGDGVPYHIDVPTEIAYLKGLEQSRTLVDIQVGNLTFTNCFVLASQFQADTWGPGRQWLEGKYTIQVSTARG